MTKRFIFSIVFTVATAVSFAQVSLLKSTAEKISNEADMIHGSLSVCVLDVKKDSVIYEMNSKIGLVPASCLKVITTGAALGILGENFKFETKLEYDGIFDALSGILKGNIYIKGSGDPTLDSKYFKTNKDTVDLMTQWAEIISKKGIKKIEGSVIADASAFEDEVIPGTWIWSDMGNYFGAGACGLNYKDNLYTVHFKAGGYGDSARVNKIFPAIPNLKIRNNVTVGGNSDNASIYGMPYDYNRYATGTIPANKNGYDIDGSMPDPAWFCAYSLDSALRKLGVEVAENPTSVRELQLLGQYKLSLRKAIHSHFSPPLSKIVYHTNKRSINLYAECLLKSIALKKNGLGSENSGVSAVTDFWKKKNVDVNGLYMSDGSGLSRWNSISTGQLAEILRTITKEIWFQSFYNSLPNEGKNTVAKSGYITRVRSYSGYVKKKNGDFISFSIIANNYDCPANEIKNKLEKLMIIISGLN